MMTPLELAENVVGVLDSKKAGDIKVLKTEDLTTLANYFVICTATSTTHLKTLADEVGKAMAEKGEPPLRAEGPRSGGWVLIDFGCVVAHLFLEETRGFYSLERLWSDADNVDVLEILGKLKADGQEESKDEV